MCTIRDLSVDVEIGEFLGCIEDIESKESFLSINHAF